MDSRIKPMMSVMGLALLGLAAVTDAPADSAQTELVMRRQLEACIAEVGRRADYQNAVRVVHRVTPLGRRRIADLAMRIDTAVFLKGKDVAVREYTASCVAAYTGRLLEFRIER